MGFSGGGVESGIESDIAKTIVTRELRSAPLQWEPMSQVRDMGHPLLWQRNTIDIPFIITAMDFMGCGVSIQSPGSAV